MSEHLNNYYSTQTLSGYNMVTVTGIAPRFTGAPSEDFSGQNQLFCLAVQAK